jgi:VWFA-related protein
MQKIVRIALLFAVSTLPLGAQAANGQTADREPTLKVTTRAVVEDVVVTDSHGDPVKGLPASAFTLTEQGKPQAITFFEEHRGGPIAPVAAPKLPPDVFSNFSAYPLPAAVNVVLLDSLNTSMGKQSWIHDQALRFLKNGKPGTQTAIFGMGLGFRFIQGFTGDPAVLVAALKNKKNNNVEQSVMLVGQEQSDAESNLASMMSAGGGTAASSEAAAALSNFFAENTTSQTFDRFFLTLANLQQLATFLNSFPGRKNVIWFAESVPAVFQIGPGSGGPQENPAIEAELKKTMNMLAAARVALYPVDAHGLVGNSLYEAQTVLPDVTQPSQLLGPAQPLPTSPDQGSGSFATNMTLEDQARNSAQAAMDLLAEQTGGRAFYNTNGIGQVMDSILKSTEDFYTLSYSPANKKMDGGFRKIKVKVPDRNYKLAYRRGYHAIDAAVPGNALDARKVALTKYAEEKHGDVDPLLPFMDLGMPQSDQILYEARVNPLPADASDKKSVRYGVDFTVDLKDLDLKQGADGAHDGILNFTLLIYDRYGKIIDHQVYVAALNIKPGEYATYEKAGVPLHADIATPKGNYWLRTGIYDESSRKVGTLEIPLAAVKPVDSASRAGR